jgi:hypothetical protein
LRFAVHPPKPQLSLLSRSERDGFFPWATATPPATAPPAKGSLRREGYRLKTISMSEIEDKVDRELFRNVEKLRQLRIEHRDLDEVISRLSLDLRVDELQIKRLKKRKLLLKDQITRLESKLIPDLNA